jgi:DNA-binding NtrC family response regulator
MDENASLPRKIVVVDDDLDTLRTVIDILSHLGHHPVMFRKAEEALDYVKSHSVDLLLIDYRMPELTGLDLISMLREEGHEIPAIIMTGFVETKERISATTPGITGILIKPITVPLLTDAVNKVFCPGKASVGQ